jgi:undecaprenyl diphosphate synthase
MHISIIMDGNGRWAKKRGLNRLDGHREGVESVRIAMEYAVEKGINYLSLYAFSEENWNRPVEEVDGLMELMVEAIMNERKTMMDNNIRFRVIGNLGRISERVMEKINGIVEESSDNTGLNMIVYLSYSGKWDIIQAVNKFINENRKSGAKLDIDTMNGYLSTTGIPDPDLVIRTSGEQRLSNFMLWQAAYSEFYFTDVLWPDFRKTDFEKALNTYSKRERRYGQTGAQINKNN